MFLQEAVPKYSQELKYSDKRNLQCTNQMLKIHLQLPIPIFLALSDKHAFQLLCLQKAFFFHSPYIDLFGKESSVDTKQHSCMFHKLQDKKQLSFIFQLFLLVSVERNHTYTHTVSQKYKDLCTVSFHLISLVHTVI